MDTDFIKAFTRLMLTTCLTTMKLKTFLPSQFHDIHTDLEFLFTQENRFYRRVTFK